jgi:hypothetical protein
MKITTVDNTVYIEGMSRRNRTQAKEYKEIINALENRDGHISVSNSTHYKALTVYNGCKFGGNMAYVVEFKSEKTMRTFHTQLRTDTKVKYPIC